MVEKINNFEEITGDFLDPKSDIKLQANEKIAASFDDQGSDLEENKESLFLELQNKILWKPDMTEQHKQRLQKKTDALIANKDEAGLEQLDKNINFSEIGGVIISTIHWPLAFAPKQASYEDIEHIDWIKEDQNIWRKNRATWTPIDKDLLDDVLSDLALDDVISGSLIMDDTDQVVYDKWLWVNFDAIESMKKAGKKICTAEQFLLAATAFPGGIELWDTLDNPKWSTKVVDLFDLLWAKQPGFRDSNWNWHSDFRVLWSSSDSSDRADYDQSAYDLRCAEDTGGFHLYEKNNKKSAYGVWFIEN